MLENTEEYETHAPFNNALARLELIHNLIKTILVVSSGISPDGSLSQVSKGEGLAIKYKLVKQLYIASAPLLKLNKDFSSSEHETHIQNELKRLKPGYTERYVIDSRGYRVIAGQTEAYDEQQDEDLDTLVIYLQKSLQKDGYFMPKKDDPRNAWKQS